MDAAEEAKLLANFWNVLDAEIFFQNRKRRMGLDQIKARLAHIAGIERLTAEVNPDGTESFSLGEQTVEIPAGNAAKRHRARYLSESLTPTPQAIAKVDEAVAAITIETAITIQPKPERSNMSITGLQSGAFQAKLAEMKQRIADAQNAGLAKMDGAAVAGAAKVDAAATGVVAKVDSEVESALQEFAEFTNGGPA